MCTFCGVDVEYLGFLLSSPETVASPGRDIDVMSRPKDKPASYRSGGLRFSGIKGIALIVRILDMASLSTAQVLFSS